MAFLKIKKSKLYEDDVRKLIKAITKFDENEENFQLCLDFTLSNILHHTYLDADSHKIERSLKGLHEKYLVHSNLEKANAFHLVNKKLLDIFNQSLPHEKEFGFRVLALLLHLSKSDHSDQDIFLNNDAKNYVSAVESGDKLEKIDWTAYLQEGEDKYGPLSDYNDSLSTDEDDDSFDDISIPKPSKNPPRDDSGIGISPDSTSGTSSQPLFQSINDLKYYSKPPSIDPSAAKSYLESKYLYWVHGCQELYSKCPYNLKTVNFTKAWEEHVQSEQPCLLIQRKVVVHERNIIREVLWMLSGIKNLFLFSWDGEKFAVNTSVHLCNLTSNTLESLLQQFCDYGNKAEKLRSFTNYVLLQDHNSREPCMTYQAFAEAISQLMQNILIEFSNLEKSLKLKKETFTLLILHHKLQDSFYNLEALHEILERVSNTIPETCQPFERAVWLLHILWKYISQQYSWISSSSRMKAVFKIFLKTCYPYFRCLEEFMFNGVLNDPHGEFIIVRKKDVGVLDENYWSNAFQLRSLPRDVEEDFFLKPILQNVLITGKSIVMLHQINILLKQLPFRLLSKKDELYLKFVYILRNLLRDKKSQKAVKIFSPGDGVSETEIKQDISIQQDPLLENKIFEFNKETARFFQPKVNPAYITTKKGQMEKFYTDEQLLIQSLLDEMEPTVLRPLNLSIQTALKICMKYACYPTCKKLMEALRENHNLMKHMVVIKKYFLMESGNVMFSFYSKIFEKIFYNEAWQDVSFLSNTLDSAISDDKENAKKICIFLDNTYDGSQSQQQLSLLNSLQLSYEIEWPISVILGTKAQSQYGLIFCFLLQIKCAKYILDKLYCKSFCLYKSASHRNELMRLLAASEFPREQKIHGMYIIRMRLMYFINGFHNYIMTRILHSFGIEFNKRLENANTLEEIIAAHNLYLKSLQERCLLDPRLPYLKEYIFRVLNLTVPFQKLWRRGADNVSVEELQNIEMEFSTCNNFLMSYLKKPLKRGSYPHLEILSSAMLSESHSMHLFENKKETSYYSR